MDPYLEILKRVRTPIVYDAIERFNLRPRSEGYTDASIQCLFPEFGPLVGYACTAKIVAELPPGSGEKEIPLEDVWRYASAAPHPSVMVVQDLDQPPARGCTWGDVAASIFLRLGCVGAVTNGGARDLQEVKELGFHLFASTPVVGHSYARYVEIDTPVKVGSLVINSGELLHGDEHGILVIPKEIPLQELVRVVNTFLASEKTIVDYCAKPEFVLDELIQRFENHNRKLSTLA